MPPKTRSVISSEAISFPPACIRDENQSANLNSEPIQSGKRKRGRPPTFGTEDRERFAALIRLHGLHETREVLGRSISCPTLSKIAHEYGIPLPKGRQRPKAA